MKTATFVKELDSVKGEAELYRLSEPVEYGTWEEDATEKTSFVAVSAVDTFLDGLETYIFPADQEGNILDWVELEGSYEGELNIRKALENAGYKVIGGLPELPPA